MQLVYQHFCVYMQLVYQHFCVYMQLVYQHLCLHAVGVPALVEYSLVSLHLPSGNAFTLGKYDFTP